MNRETRTLSLAGAWASDVVMFVSPGSGGWWGWGGLLKVLGEGVKLPGPIAAVTIDPVRRGPHRGRPQPAESDSALPILCEQSGALQHP